MEYHLGILTEAALLERTPAFAIDYLYKIDLPDDFSSDKISELGSDLEYSNLAELALCRFVGGPFVLRLCSGLVHRFDTLRQIGAMYEYAPYCETPAIPELSELRTPSEDDYDALNTNIPTRTYQFTFFKPVVEFQLMDHGRFKASKTYLFKKRKNLPNAQSNYILNYPKFTIECECIDGKFVGPMYPKRLVFTTCQLPTAPSQMFNACYQVVNAKVIGLGSRLIFGSNKQTTIIMPSNGSLNLKNIIFPKFWINPDICHTECCIDVESLTLTGTKSRIIVINHIIDKFLKLDAGDFKYSIFTTSLLQDASKDTGMVVLELLLEGLKMKNIQTISTVLYDFSLSSLKAFILKPNEYCGASVKGAPFREPHQVLIVSGPESSNDALPLDAPLLNATFQYPKNLENHIHPPLLFFNIAEIKACIDPVFFDWFLYTPRNVNIRPEYFWAQECAATRKTPMSETSGSLHETPRRAHTPHESIHSSSDREPSSHLPRINYESRGPRVEEKSIYDTLLEWYPIWSSIVLFGNINQCTLYFPTYSLTAVGLHGIQEAVDMSLKKESPPEIVVVKLPNCSIRSASQRRDLGQFVNRFPIKLPENMWTPMKQSFPWCFSIWDFSCYSLQNDSKLNFLKPVSGNATIGLSIKHRIKKDNVRSCKSDSLIDAHYAGEVKKHKKNKLANMISVLGLCVHIDNTPIVISISDAQLNTMANILNALVEVTDQKSSNYKEKSKLEPSLSVINKSSSPPPNLFKESTIESISEVTPTNADVLTIKDLDSEEDDEEMRLTAWVQWTITRFTLKFYTHNFRNSDDTKYFYLLPPTLKLVLDMEDIMSSLDLQKVYMKFKSKIVMANVNHYKRDDLNKPWESGSYLGFVMRVQDEIPPVERQEECGFLSITVTTAKCGHVHSKWGTGKKHKLAEAKIDPSTKTLDSRYISEIVVNVQPVDLLISLATLKNFYMIFDPLNCLRTGSLEPVKSSSSSYLDNSKLPLAYLECHGLRVIMPVSDLNVNSSHDVCILEVNNVSLVPMADNPICRTPIRADIYQQAAQARILNIPGSEVEDRQYQFNINCLSVNTGLWEEFSEIIAKERSAVSCLHTMNENPALEWNNMGGKVNLMPHLTLLPIVKKFDMCFVIAPAIVYKTDNLVCGSSVEINFVSDIEITLSLCQIRLLSMLSVEFLKLFESKICKVPSRKKFSYISTAIFDEELPKDYFDVFIEYMKDSGVETSGQDINSEITIKTKESCEDKKSIMKLCSERTSEHSAFKCSSVTTINYYPLEILVAGGEISFSLYKIKNLNSRFKCVSKSHKKKCATLAQDRGYEASEEGSIDETNVKQEMQPLLFVLFAQPNMFFSQMTLGNKINFSCFDFGIKISGPEYKPTSWIPTINDYPLNLLETKAGTPDPETGIPPAFLTLKYGKAIGKTPSLNVEFDRPIKITYCLVQWSYLLCVKSRIVNITKDSYKNLTTVATTQTGNTSHASSSTSTNPENYSKYKKIKSQLFDLNNINVKFAQFVFEIKSDIGPEMILSIAKFDSCLTLSNRPERITNVINLENITITTNVNNSKKILLNPWSCNFDVCLFWECWQNINSDPQIQLAVGSDNFVLDLGPEQLKTIDCIVKECRDVMNVLNKPTSSVEMKTDTFSPERDQHYKDDLRAGAFQFIDATGCEYELPLPYQVMFWNGTTCAMAWRYPQPRVLTKVRVFPVPFKISETDQRVVCNLEYWSDCHGCYQSYTQFQLSESEVCYLDLPKDCPRPTVSCTWRVVLSMFDNESIVNVKALAACMRIDSYFNPLLIPKVQIAINLTSFCVQLYNQFKNDTLFVMPKALNGYTADGLIPDNQRFLTFSLENVSVYLATWVYDTAMFDFTSSVRCNILDYACLTEEALIFPFTLKVTMNLSDTTNINVWTRSINVKFTPAIGHTLAVSAQTWNQTYNAIVSTQPELVIVTRYVICNNTNYNVRFGQAGTEEDILLPSKFLHMYSWRSQKFNQMIRIGVEQCEWIWFDPINIDEVRTETMDLKKGDDTLTIIVSVKELSSTQKQITFSGQLMICNMLLEHFEMKLVPAISESKDCEFRKAQSHIVSGKSLAPSLIVNLRNKLCLRLRFYGLEAAWSGDIPLEENSKCAQPWLVKVPLQERGQFLSIWCRIIDQNNERDKRIMVLLWPLFMVRSNLPVNAEVHIETPVLNVNVETIIRGRGELQQLYCPGTIDHSHQLTFQLDSETPVSNPYVPLNYSLVDQKMFFKKPDKQNIDEIMEILRTYDESKWPYIEDSKIDWIAEDQPLTHVQVHYQNACQYSSSLLVELLPWCLMLNTLGCDIAIIANNGQELCRARHNGIVTPPKLDSTFQISVGIGETWNISPILQLAKADWSQSFYKPKINGVIPWEGNLVIPIKCENGICVSNINTNVNNEIQILEIRSSHVLTNHTSLQLQIACLALPDDERTYNVPSDVNKYSFSLAPHLSNSYVGVPIIHWYTPHAISETSNYTLHIMVTIDKKCSWSCPVRVDRGLIRKNISFYGTMKNIPLLIIGQESKGQIYISIHHDHRPQLLIENKCSSMIFCAQYGPDNSIVKDNAHFNWTCSVPMEREVYYSLPSVGEKFPEIVPFEPENIVIAVPSSSKELTWSQPVDINNHNEQYLRIPVYGDVKLIIKKIVYTVLIQVVSITEIEISAGDIRNRLTYHENQVKNMIENVPVNLLEETFEKSCPIPISRIGSTTTLSSVYFSSTDVTNEDIPDPKPGMSNKLPVVEEKCECSDELMISKTAWSDLSYSTHDYGYQERASDWSSLSVSVFIEGFELLLVSDAEESGFGQTEIAAFNCDNIAFTCTKNQGFNIHLSVSQIQFDNQLFFKSSYDFPVLFVGQNKPAIIKLKTFIEPIKTTIAKARENALVTLHLHFDEWIDGITEGKVREVRDVKIEVKPIYVFIEDKFLTKLWQIVKNLLPSELVLWPKYASVKNFNLNSTLSLVHIPEGLVMESQLLARPVMFNSFVIEPISVSLSAHSSIKIYLAVDCSPINFSRFEKKNLITTQYKLGTALTMHYISGAIFSSGWVISSWELLGSPGGLARSVGSGLKDFISLPYHGFIQGPWAFIIGVTHGSASLMKHITAGTLHSVTKMASSVARNLDRLTMDEEHLQRAEESRRFRPQGLGQGLVQGLTGFGISLLGAVGGIAHHPLQAMMREGVSPRGLATGVGLGLVGVITKPLSGAAELVAFTGQGLLQGAGWNPLPEPRSQPSSYHVFSNLNSILKYKWKFLHNITSNSNLFTAIEATLITNITEYLPVTLVLTNEALIIFNTDEDSAQRIIHLNEIISIDTTTDPTLICFILKAPTKHSECNDPLAIEMDPACRARVANYVRNSASLIHLPSRDSSPDQSDIDISPICSIPSSPIKHTSDSPQISFFVNPQYRNYFYNMLAFAKQQSQDNTFRIV